MTKPEKAHRILNAVDEAYSIPSYLQEDVHTAIVKALVQIEREEAQSEKEGS